MDFKELETRLCDVLAPLVARDGFELIELRLQGIAANTTIRLLVDKLEGSINLDECAQLNRTIGNELEAHNILPGHYVIEVSSPGLDRALKTQKDFVRLIGSTVRFFLSAPVEGKIEWEGSIIGSDSEAVRVSSQDKEIVIPLLCINKAKRVF